VGTRALAARLTWRFLGVAGTALVAASLASIGLARHALDVNDTEAAADRAVGTLYALDRELGEGDSLEEALREVVDTENADGARVAIWRQQLLAGREQLPILAPGACTTLNEPGASGVPEPWRACAARRGDTLAIAEVPIAAHRAVVATLAKWMLLVIALGFVALWIAVRRAVKVPLGELAALVEWTATVARAEVTFAPPAAETREIVRLGVAFDALVRRLLESLARERASSAHIAHELRTPLTAIVIELENLARREPSARGPVERVLGDVARFGDVIDSILVLSSGASRRKRDEAIVNVADLARELAPDDAVAEAPEEALVEGDEHLVRLALRNLIENARKYAGGARILRVALDGGSVRLSVIDAGPGVESDALQRMFDRFWRGSADGEGRGLGLALVRAVAERYGGRAEARPGPDGRGLEVSMTIDRVVGWHDGEPPYRH
jgi:signal transduction histidine kinase